jgi:AI-2 transport protein TqsA
LTQGDDKPAAPAARSAPSAPAKDANEAVGAAAEPNEAAERQWHIDTRQIVKDLIANARQIMQDMANHMFAMLRNTVTAIFGLLSGTLFVFFFVIFLLAGRNPYAEHSQMYTDVVRQIRRYLATKVIISAVVGVLVWASLAILGMELAGVFGILAFLLNFIPVIGPIIVTVLPIPLAVAQFQSSWPVILVVVIPGAIHNIIGNIIEPKLMGEGLDLHPVTILLALSFWGMLWGIVGTFLAVPITAALRIVLMQFDTSRPIGNLLAGEVSSRLAPAPHGARCDARDETVLTTASASAPPEGTEPAGSPRG